MAIEKTYLLGKNITLGCGFDLQAKAPLDSRQVVPEYDGLQALIDGNAAYEGMIVYDEGTKKTYQAQLIDGVLAFREFGITEAELKDLIAAETTAAMEFKGATASLPENPAKGDMWKIAANFKIDDEDVKVGDSIVYNGEQWFIIPSGDDIEDTWRPVDGVANDASLKFEAGAKLDVAVANNGTITYSHEAIAAPELLAENEQTRTYITEVVTDGYGHITGYKTATENVENTDTTYEFECQVEEGHSNVHFSVKASTDEHPQEICLDAYTRNEVDAKVEALNLEIYGNKAVQETSRIDTAVDNAAEALRVAGVAAGDAAEAKSAAQDAVNAQTGAAASASAAAQSATDADTARANAVLAKDDAVSAKESAIEAKNAAISAQETAASSASDAAASANTASDHATTATDKAKAADESATAAAGSAQTASEKATAADNSAKAAASSESNAAASAQTASTKAGEASISASNADTARADAVKAQTAAEAAQAAAEEAKAAAVDSNTSATAIANQAKSAADAATEAVAGLHKLATSGSIYDVNEVNAVKVDDKDVFYFVFNCGSATTLID